MTASEPAVTTGIPTPEALALLPVPAGLSVPQMDGRVCVYDNETLTPETAVDLGRREQGGRLVCARASRGCVTRAAQAALYRHAAGPNACPDCQAAPICDTGRALVRVIKVGARR